MQLVERISLRCPSCDFTGRDGCQACNHHGYLIWTEGRLSAPQTPHASDGRNETKETVMKTGANLIVSIKNEF